MTVWNEHRNGVTAAAPLRNDFYRARKSIIVFEKIGFTISGTAWWSIQWLSQMKQKSLMIL